MRHTESDLALLLALPIVFLNQVLWPSLSGKSLLPFDNLYAFEPYASARSGRATMPIRRMRPLPPLSPA